MKVACAIVIRDGHVLVQERLRSNRRISEFPSGKVDEGESFEQCALRELVEETGLVGTILANALVLLNGETGFQVGFVPISVSPEASPHSDPRRNQIFKWCTPENIPLRDFNKADRDFIGLHLPNFLAHAWR